MVLRNQIIWDHVAWLKLADLDFIQAFFSSFTWYFCGPTAAIHIPMLTSSPCNKTSKTDSSHYICDYLHYFPTVAWCSVLHLVGLQFLCITGEPLDQVTRDHVAWAAGKRRVSWTGVLQLLPLPNAIYCPALPETGSRWQIHHHHHILSPVHLMPHGFDCALSIPVSFIPSSADDALKL